MMNEYSLLQVMHAYAGLISMDQVIIMKNINVDISASIAADQ